MHACTTSRSVNVHRYQTLAPVRLRFEPFQSTCKLQVFLFLNFDRRRIVVSSKLFLEVVLGAWDRNGRARFLYACSKPAGTKAMAVVKSVRVCPLRCLMLQVKITPNGGLSDGRVPLPFVAFFFPGGCAGGSPSALASAGSSLENISRAYSGLSDLHAYSHIAILCRCFQDIASRSARESGQGWAGLSPSASATRLLGLCVPCGAVRCSYAWRCKCTARPRLVDIHTGRNMPCWGSGSGSGSG